MPRAALNPCAALNPSAALMCAATVNMTTVYQTKSYQNASLCAVVLTCKQRICAFSKILCDFWTISMKYGHCVQFEND